MRRTIPAAALSVERVRELFSYDAHSGSLTWKSKSGRRCRIGSRAGYRAANGYVRVSVDGRFVFAHRVAWMLIHGELVPAAVCVDHINGDPADNRACNLRLATGGQNNANSRIRSDNTSSYKGVTWAAKRSKWEVKIKVDKKKVHVGYFLDIDQAHAAYVAAAQKHFGAFARIR